MKKSQKATLAVIVGFAGFLATTTYDIVSDPPAAGSTGKTGKITELPRIEGTISTLKNDASQIPKRQARSRLSSVHRTNTARS